MRHPYRTPAPPGAFRRARGTREVFFVFAVCAAGVVELVAVHGWRTEPSIAAPLAIAGVLMYLAGVFIASPPGR